MINLLPPQGKEEVLQEKKYKLVLILGILVITFFLSLSLILFSIKIFISGEIAAQGILFEQKEKEFQNPQIQTLQENLIAFNLTLSKLNSFYQSQFNLTKLLEKISQILPREIRLINLSLVPESKEKKEWQMICNLSGFSPTREILLEFKKNLENEQLFGEINFPPESWVKAEDINFTVSFKIR